MLRERQAAPILLVSCYELGHQPLGLASPAAFLARAGHRVDVLDLSVEPLTPAHLESVRLVGISVPMHTALRIGTLVARRIREAAPDCHIVYYGLYASLNAEYLLHEGQADSVLGGEHEEALVELAGRVLGDEERPGGPRSSAAAPEGSQAPPLRKLDFPVPVRDGLPSLDRYARLQHAGALELAGYVEASRGCLHFCRHCPIPPVYGGRIFVIPAEVVLADIDRQVAAGARHITFGDPDFLNGPGHVMAIVRGLHARHPDVTFDITAKVEHLLRDAALLPELAQLGCLFVISAFESVSDEVLTRLDKGHTRADLDRVLELVRAAGMSLRPTWVPFTPWTTARDYLDLLAFIEEGGLIDHVEPVQLALRLLVPPGSLLLEDPSMRARLGELDRAGFVWRWNHPDSRMDALQRDGAALAEAAAKEREDSMTTFYRLKSLALERLAGTEFAIPDHPPLAARHPAPRLTEDWFC